MVLQNAKHVLFIYMDYNGNFGNATHLTDVSWALLIPVMETSLHDRSMSTGLPLFFFLSSMRLFMFNGSNGSMPSSGIPAVTTVATYDYTMTIIYYIHIMKTAKRSCLGRDHASPIKHFNLNLPIIDEKMNNNIKLLTLIWPC